MPNNEQLICIFVGVDCFERRPKPQTCETHLFTWIGTPTRLKTEVAGCSCLFQIYCETLIFLLTNIEGAGG